MIWEDINLYIEVMQEDLLNVEGLYREAFEKALQNNKKLHFPFLANPHLELSKALDQSNIQSSSSTRLLRLAEVMADTLVNEKAEVPFDILDPMIKELEKNLFWAGPGRELDAKGREHQLNVLKKLRENRELGQLLSSIHPPDNHPIADNLIRKSLQLDAHAKLTRQHATKAALIAWLTPLRQSIGSCFATAPALVIQEEHPQYLLRDIQELLATGRIQRTFEGVSYEVPLSASFGIGDLNRPLNFSARNPIPFEKASSSPGLQQSFIAMQLIDPEEEHALLKRLEETLQDLVNRYQEITLTVEDVMKLCLMKDLELTKKDLEEYANRPKQMIYSDLLVTTARGSREGKSLRDRAALYYQLLEQGKEVFVGFTDNPLLKAWEFSLASFAETKANFSKWNLYSSLGLDPREEGGIGEAMHKTIAMQLEEKNRRVEDLQEEYKMLYHQLMLAEGRFKSASSEEEARWVRADYQRKRNEYNTFEEMRNLEHQNAQKLANLLNHLVDRFIELFPTYFQEVYDPDLHDVSAGPYDDSPAGFRLLYKHGRSSSAQWTFVKNYQDFTSSLDQFFIACEHQLQEDPEIKGIEKEVSEVITQISLQIKRDEFIESAFRRMAIQHRTPVVAKPLDNLDKIAAKPWAYTSGGGMASLVSNYFCNPDKPKEKSRWVESPHELFVFAADLIKEMPDNMVDRSLLTHSPTHAFRLLPWLKPFSNSWQSEEFTYSYVRDSFLIPQQEFYRPLRLDREMMSDLIQKVRAQLPGMVRPHFDETFQSLPASLSPQEFKEEVKSRLEKDRALSVFANQFIDYGEIDSLLYRNIPYTRAYQFKEKLYQVIEKADLIPVVGLEEKIANLLSHSHHFEVVSAEAMLKLALTLLIQEKGQVTFPYNPQEKVIRAMRDLLLLPPAPAIFADTNWVANHFAFLVNPTSLELEFWRIDPLGVNGYPMNDWKKWLDGSRKKPDWGVYVKPEEYS